MNIRTKIRPLLSQKSYQQKLIINSILYSLKNKKKKNTGRYIRHIIDQYKYKEYIEIKI